MRLGEDRQVVVVVRDELLDLTQAVMAFVVGEGLGEVQAGQVEGDVADVEV